MANSKYIGLITCPLCGNEHATVHEQQKGTKVGRRYIRCYSEINGNKMECGTLQCIGPSGQRFIERNLKPLEPVEKPIAQNPPEPTPEPEPANRPIGQNEPKQRPIGQKRSLFDVLFSDEEAA